MTRAFALYLFALCLLAGITPLRAAADAIAPPPESCPPHSTPHSDHLGPYCVAQEACPVSDAVCPGGDRCQPVTQCIVETGCLGPRYDTGFHPDTATPPCVRRDVVGPCASDGSCTRGACMT